MLPIKMATLASLVLATVNAPMARMFRARIADLIVDPSRRPISVRPRSSFVLGSQPSSATGVCRGNEHFAVGKVWSGCAGVFATVGLRACDWPPDAITLGA